MNLNEFFEKTTKKINGFDMLKIRPLIHCNDGFTVSVQASHTHYCSPRDNNGRFYTSVECGFPSELPPDSWMEYAEEDKRPLKTVYAWIPVDLVEQAISEHGGIDAETTFPLRDNPLNANALRGE